MKIPSAHLPKITQKRTRTRANEWAEVMERALACLLVFALVSPVFGQVAADNEHIDSIKKKVAACLDKQRKVVIETYDRRRLQGSISEAGDIDFALSYGGQVKTLSYAEVKTIRWHSEAWRQVKIVAGAAAIVGAIFGAVVLLGGLKG